MSQNTQLISFHGDPAIKEKYIQRIKEHAKLDHTIRGFELHESSQKGSAVECTLGIHNLSSYESELGIPMILAVMENNIFGNLSVADSKTFPLEFLEAIPVGVNLDKIYPLFFSWKMTVPEYGILSMLKNEKDKEAIQKLPDLYTQLGTGKITVEIFRKADRAYLIDKINFIYHDYLTELTCLADRAYLTDNINITRQVYLTYHAYFTRTVGYYPAMRNKLIQLLKDAK